EPIDSLTALSTSHCAGNLRTRSATPDCRQGSTVVIQDRCLRRGVHHVPTLQRIPAEMIQLLGPDFVIADVAPVFEGDGGQAAAAPANAARDDRVAHNISRWRPEAGQRAARQWRRARAGKVQDRGGEISKGNRLWHSAARGNVPWEANYERHLQ